ncbi:MAG: peptidylprolyl isomerase [Halobacteriaceae archaeon]
MTDEAETAAEADDGAEDAEVDADTESGEGIEDGDFLRIEYTVRTADDGEVVDTTDRDLAEEEGFDLEEREFGPRVVVVGGEELFDAVDEDLVGKAAGASNAVHIPAADAFGAYDEEEVRTVSADRIPEDERYPGAHVDIDGQHGHVETIIGGRARVDFNHPLAGEDLEYEYEVVEVITHPVEMAKGLLQARFDVAPEISIETDEVEEEVTVEPDEDDEDAKPETTTEVVEKRTLYIESVPQLQFNQQWMFGKQQVAQELIDRLDIDRVIVQEIIDGQPAGPMGGMPGMMGGTGGAPGAGEEGLGEALEDAEVDADELVEELDDE